jgi:CxxC-x17-CxxC domain-containing protein
MGFQGGQGGYDRGPREMHKAICADCKKECEVPFKPREDRPVYCKECFSKHKDSSR